MVVIASGTRIQVQRWSVALSAASIEFSPIQPCGDDNLPKADYWELWIARKDSERARSVIHLVQKEDKRLLW
jgi:hypothetical protein